MLLKDRQTKEDKDFGFDKREIKIQTLLLHQSSCSGPKLVKIWLKGRNVSRISSRGICYYVKGRNKGDVLSTYRS